MAMLTSAAGLDTHFAVSNEPLIATSSLGALVRDVGPAQRVVGVRFVITGRRDGVADRGCRRLQK